MNKPLKNIDDILHKDAGCGSELDYVEQTSQLSGISGQLLLMLKLTKWIEKNYPQIRFERYSDDSAP